MPTCIILGSILAVQTENVSVYFVIPMHHLSLGRPNTCAFYSCNYRERCHSSAHWLLRVGLWLRDATCIMLPPSILMSHGYGHIYIWMTMDLEEQR